MLLGFRMCCHPRTLPTQQTFLTPFWVSPEKLNKQLFLADWNPLGRRLVRKNLGSVRPVGFLADAGNAQSRLKTGRVEVCGEAGLTGPATRLEV
jgi:hypothetical protein